MDAKETLGMALTSYRESSTKHDFFMTGLTAALVAYIGKGVPPQCLSCSVNAYNMELLALGLLLMSFILALLRNDSRVWLDAASYERVKQEDMRVTLQRATSQTADGAAVRNMASGQVFTAKMLDDLITEVDERIAKCTGYEDRARRRAEIAAKWRDPLLAAGFAALIGARIMQPYFPVVAARLTTP